MTTAELVELAFSMHQYSYVPYSHFPVGAVLVCADGTRYTGCNVENASLGGTICAERCALLKAISEGHTDDFAHIVIAGNSDDYCYPCGICRQVLYEFAPQLQVTAANKHHQFVTFSLSDLMPHGFGPKALKTDP